MEEGSYLDKKKKRSDLWWVSDERFLALEDERKEQLLNPSRTVTLPDVDVTSHILNNAAAIALGIAVLAKRGIEAGKAIDSAMLDELRANLSIICDFNKAYDIVK